MVAIYNGAVDTMELLAVRGKGERDRTGGLYYVWPFNEHLEIAGSMLYAKKQWNVAL